MTTVESQVPHTTGVAMATVTTTTAAVVPQNVPVGLLFTNLNCRDELVVEVSVISMEHSCSTSYIHTTS